MNYRDIVTDRGLPSNTEAERVLLGALMLGADAGLVADCLTHHDFSLRQNQLIFAAIVAMHKRGVRCDRITLTDEIMRANVLDAVGGLAYIVSLDAMLPEISNLDAYVNIIRDKAVIRRAVLSLHQALDKLLAEGVPTGEALDWIERKVQDLAALADPDTSLTVAERIDEAGGPGGILYTGGQSGASVPTPWRALNEILEGGGLPAGQMITLGARPSLGKTSIACQIAHHAAAKGHDTIFFTLEMTPEQLMRRMIFTAARVDSNEFSRNACPPSEISRCHEAALELQKARLAISNRGTIPGIRSVARKYASKRPLSLIVIDYLGLLQSIGAGQYRKKYEEVSELSRSIKLLAEELRVPVLVLAQLNREVDKEKRSPRASDLRDSGTIEQDSDIILMPHSVGPDQYANVLEVDLIIVKQRNGATGKIPMIFERRYTRYAMRSEELEEPRRLF